jgi:hypothetical protein
VESHMLTTLGPAKNMLSEGIKHRFNPAPLEELSKHGK